MKVIIAGPRHIYSTALVRHGIRESGFEITEIVSGRARGCDRAGEDVAMIDKIPWKAFPADWDKYGNVAGPIRNQEMGVYADAAIVIWDGKSTGSGHMIRTMENLGKPVHVVMTE